MFENMTYDELLVESLSIIQEQVKEELSYETGSDEASKEIREEYEASLKVLDCLVPKIKGTDSLYDELDEDEFAFIVECLENYQENFVIDGTDPQKLKEDEEKYSLLSDFMFDLYGSDEDYEDEGDDESE